MIPIFILCNKESKEIPERSKKLLPYTLRYIISEVRRITNVYLITDDIDITLDYPEFKSVLLPESIDDISDLAYALTTVKCREFIWISLTHPLRSWGLLRRLMKDKSTKTFIVDSYTDIDRSIFEINKGKFKIPNISRDGVLCPKKTYVGGSIFRCNSEFIKRVSKLENPCKEFWNSPFTTIEQGAPFIEINTGEDLDRLLYYYNV